MTLVARMDRALYPGQTDHWDDALLRREVLRDLRSDHDLLDLGAGAGCVREMDFRGLVHRACGVDPDERVLVNPHLDEGRTGCGESIPYAAETFHVIVADNVLEHLDAPAAVFAEMARVLRPGGRIYVKTPNRRHYVPLLARLTPHAFHALVNRWRGRDEEDTFPTHYRANTPRDLRRHAEGAGLRVKRILLVEGRPEYLRLHPLTYVVGWLYERLVSRVSFLARFRVVLIGVLEKGGGE